jgi:hypothetical protein
MIQPKIFQDPITLLSQHTEQHDLINRAIKRCRQWLINESSDMPYSPSAVRIEFASHSLCFCNALLSYPYIDTRLRLFVGEDEIGYYRYITFLDGTVDDDYLVFA